MTLVGKAGDDEIRMTDLARWAGTIPYEIPCLLGRRVTRIYRPDETVPQAVSTECEPASAPRTEITT